MINDRPIFVVGCPRSGTTMLQLMLHAHPRIAIPPETRFLLEGYGRRSEFGDLRQVANRRRLATWLLGRGTKARDLGLDTAVLTEEIIAGPPTLGSAIGIVFRAYAARFGKPRWGDKRPSYIQNLDILLRLFPDAQIVNIVRDGRDCVASLLEMPWHGKGVYEAISTWVRAVDAGRRASRSLPADSYYAVSYERLVEDPIAQLEALCDFLEEEFDPAMARPHELASVAIPKYKTWHRRTHRSVDGDRVGTWAERLEPWQISLCERAFGDRLADHGYQPSGLPAPSLTHQLRYAEVASRHAIKRAKRIAANGYHRLHSPGQVSAQLTVRQLSDSG